MNQESSFSNFVPTCPTCGQALLADAEPTQFFGCLTCKLVTEFLETGEFSEFKVVQKNEFLKIFANNPVIKTALENKKERQLLNAVWLLMFIILLIVSYILY